MNKMPNRKTEEAKKSRLPRGVRVFRNKQRDNWTVQVTVAGKSKSTSWDSNEAAMEHARGCSVAKKEHGNAALASLTGDEVKAWIQVREAMAGASVSQLLAVWERHKGEVLGGDVDLKVAESVVKFLEMRKLEGLSGDSMAGPKKRLERLSAALGEKSLVSVTPDDLRGWLGKLTTVRGKTKKKAEGWTLLNHYKSAHAFFERAVEEKWLVENPMTRVKTPAKPREDVTVMSLADAKKLLAANMDDPVSMRLALEMFGGLRYSSTGRLLADHLKHEQKGIHLPAKKHKSDRRHFLQKLPENLWAWVDLWKDDERAWEVLTKRMLQQRKSNAFERAGVAHPHNVLRHSFCSYHIAKHGDAAKTAVLMQHKNQTMLYDHYCGYAIEADGEAYFGITPASLIEEREREEKKKAASK